jgi:hypothetical protein
MAIRNDGRLGLLATALLVAVLGAPAHAQQTVPDAPQGFRPHSPEAANFISSLGSSVLAVLPTIVRSPDGSDFSYVSQELLVRLIHESGLATPVAAGASIELGPAPHRSQWELFQGSMDALASAMEGRDVGCDYVAMMEIVMPPGPPAVFGVHMYILDSEGRNAFSFLLNSHHKVFRDAELVAADHSDEAVAAMVADATRLAASNFVAQFEFATECEAWMAAHPGLPTLEGVFEDFEAGLPAMHDEYEVPLGFSTFADDRSDARIGVTTFHPSRRGEVRGNHTLKLEMDLRGWAGVVHLFHDAESVAWVPRDWTGFNGLSFWMYGRNSGVDFFVDVLDNRNPCATYYDDAERYTWTFVDDFAGWRQVVVPFDQMTRKEIHNGAPDDGLGLDRVHGWAIGAVDSRAAGTWYVDGVALWSHDGGTVASYR